MPTHDELSNDDFVIFARIVNGFCTSIGAIQWDAAIRFQWVGTGSGSNKSIISAIVPVSVDDEYLTTSDVMESFPFAILAKYEEL